MKNYGIGITITTETHENIPNYIDSTQPHNPFISQSQTHLSINTKIITICYKPALTETVQISRSGQGSNV